MGRIAKTIPIVVGVALLGILLCAAWACLKYESLRRSNARIAAKLDVTYQAQLVRFQDAVPLGTARSEVEKYLTAQRIPFNNYEKIVVNLGDEPGDGVVCDRWGVYAYFEFDHPPTPAKQSPASALTAITLNRIGHCL